MDKKKKNASQKEELGIIQEKLLNDQKNKAADLRKHIGRMALFGVIFGIFAAATFVFAEKIMLKRLGIDGTLRQLVAIVNASKDENEKGTVTTKPENTPMPLPSGEITPAANGAEKITLPVDETPFSKYENDTDISKFADFYSEIGKVAAEAQKSLVDITAITEGVDWFDSKYEVRNEVTGLYLGKNGRELLFLTELDGIEGAGKFEVTMPKGDVVSGELYSYDADYRLAVISVPLVLVKGIPSESLPEYVVIGKRAVESGMPILILGHANGHKGAIELGLSTGVQDKISVVDGLLPYITTGVSRYAKGDGFVFNLQGQVIGILSEKLNKGETGVFSAVLFQGMTDRIEKLMNKYKHNYLGIQYEELNAVERERLGLPSGIYVTGMETSSPALAAGITTGDIIVAIGNTEITCSEDYCEAIRKASAGKSLKITVNREVKGKRSNLNLSVTVEERIH